LLFINKKNIVFNLNIVHSHKFKNEYRVPSSSEEVEYGSSDEESEDENDRMAELIDMWWGKRKIIGKILSYVYEHEDGVDEEELKEFLRNNNYSRAWYSDLAQVNKEYKNVFERKNNTNLTKEARDYIDEME